MKKFTREELQKNAERLMAAHNKPEVFATQDGNFFFEEHEAKTHNTEVLKKNTEDRDWAIIPFKAEAEEASATGNQEQMVDHVVTEEDLLNNLDLVEQGVKIGDTIQIPAN